MKELKLLNTYKLFFEEVNESRTLYEWNDGFISYFTYIHDHHYLDITNNYCLGHTKEEAIISFKRLVYEAKELGI